MSTNTFPVFPQGTKEYFILNLQDMLGTVTDLTPYTCTFDVKTPSGSFIVTGAAATVSSTNTMQVYCLIDTTTGGASNSHDGSIHTWWAGGTDYQLYLHIAGIGSEAPELGPFPFIVDAS